MFIFPSGDKIIVGCLDWSEKATKQDTYSDHLSLELSTNEFLVWLTEVVYK